MIITFTVSPPSTWKCNDFICGPSKFLPQSKSRKANTGSFAPFVDGECFSVKGYIMTSSLIIILLAHCCPSTIFGFVISIIIDSIKTSAIWAFTHIQKECLKFVPSFTHRNSSSAIIIKFWSFRIETPLFHRGPSIPFRSSCHPMFRPKAPTRLNTWQHSSRPNNYISALTTTRPMTTCFLSCFRFPTTAIFDHGKSAESLAGYIWQSTSLWSNDVSSHLSILPKRFASWSEKLGDSSLRASCLRTIPA